ncbi:MAG: hypothetical protein HKO92_11830 [Flavobacteriaceae bacterium]|nr:hypothetical protein [Flavobacteriaceae bacterium]
MKQQHMLRYIISILCLVLFSVTLSAQNDSIPKDSIAFKNKYGIRVGADLSKLARTFLDDDYSGFEIQGDYRITRDLYVAGELGTEEKTTITEYLNSTSKGNYIKAGIDYNLYQNWYGMDNLIYSGLRVGFSTFSQTLSQYTIYDINNSAWGQNTIIDPKDFDGLTAIWAELIFGLKVQTLNNLYLGVNVQLKRRITETEPDNFENIYIPGFGRTYDSGSFGIGFGYNISYLIPLYKKGK